jgi:hypothetical protein
VKTLLVGSQSNLLLAATSTQLVAVTNTFVAASRSIFGGSTKSFDPAETLAMGGATIGGAITSTSTRRDIGVTTLECCRSESVAAARATIGSASWSASPLHDGDGLARYYPLWLNDRAVLEASEPTPDESLLATIRVTGRDIAHPEMSNVVDAAGIGEIRDGENGKLCEIPEQFRLSRYYDLPLVGALEPQPLDGLDLPRVPVLQWEWSRGFTVSMLYRYRPLRQEQTLFSLSPSLRVGVTWMGELTVEIELENGDKLNAWSTQRLPADDWKHVALTYDPDRRLVSVHLEGTKVIGVAFTRALGVVDACYFGRWNGGSLINGEAQDLRIYNSVLRPEFIAAEVNSYCADWVEVAH